MFRQPITVKQLLEKVNIQKEVEEGVGDLNRFGGTMSEIRTCLGEMELMIGDDDGPAKAQVHIIVTMNEDDFLTPKEE